MFKKCVETKIEVYVAALQKLDKDLEIIVAREEKHEHQLEYYTSVYDTLKQYIADMKLSAETIGMKQQSFDVIIKNINNIHHTFREHESEYRVQAYKLEGYNEVLTAQKNYFNTLLTHEKTILEKVEEGTIDETGSYTGNPSRRPPGVRPADPLRTRKLAARTAREIPQEYTEVKGLKVDNQASSLTHSKVLNTRHKNKI